VLQLLFDQLFTRPADQPRHATLIDDDPVKSDRPRQVQTVARLPIFYPLSPDSDTFLRQNVRHSRDEISGRLLYSDQWQRIANTRSPNLMPARIPRVHRQSSFGPAAPDETFYEPAAAFGPAVDSHEVTHFGLRLLKKASIPSLISSDSQASASAFTV
jgi:hypothetical protein